MQQNLFAFLQASVGDLCLALYGHLISKHKQKFDKLVETVLYRPPPSSAAAIEWGTSHESNARENYINEKKSKYGESYEVSKTGLFINIEQPWLIVMACCEP